MGACASAPPVADVEVPFDDAGELLYVIVPHFNPLKYASRDKLFRSCIKHLCACSNVRVVAVEQHDPSVASLLSTLPSSPRVVSKLTFASSDILWYKENLINIAISEAHRLGATFVAWVDADVTFEDRTWAVKTLEALEVRDFVQPWSTAVHVGPKGEALHTFTSFASNYTRMRHYRAVSKMHPDYWHPGLAWAAR
jgi:hypothetical protein